MKLLITHKDKEVGRVIDITTLEGGQIIATIKLNKKGKELIEDPKFIPEVFMSTPSK